MDVDLDPFEDVFDEPAAPRARPAGKFQPKNRPRKGKAAAVAPPSVHATAAANKSTETGDGGGGDATLGDLDFSSRKADAAETVDIFLGLDAIHDLVTQPPSDPGVSVPCTNEGLAGPQSSSLVQESVDSSEFRSDMATKDPVAVDNDGERLLSEASGGFPNLEATNVFSESAVASDGVDSLVPPEDTYLIASETRYESESSLPAAQGDAVSYYSSRSFDDYLPSPPPASEFPMSSEHTDSRQIFTLNEADKNDSLRVAPDLVENEGQESREKNGLEPDLSRKSKANGRNGGKLLRKRSGTRQAVDQPENEGYVGSSSPVGAPGFLVTDEENDSEYQLDGDDNNDNGGDDDFDGGESTDKKKKASKRSKKSVPDKETGGRKRKKASETSEQPSQKPPKKFAHTTRRKKRYRNDELLKVPEDEIDFRSLPIRDIIFLGEHRERLAAKEAKALKSRSTDEGTSTAHNAVDEAELDEAVNISDNTPLFNSHSFMNRTRKVRWSKQETELFYEGIRQFGTDLSLVQQLFPGRDRRQIKNKFKAEERRQPFLLFEALGNRDRDSSYFERVIDQLQKAAAEAGRESKRDEPTDEAEEGEEAEAGNSERDEPATAGHDPEEIIADAPSPGKFEEEEIIEDEDDLWSSYQSEF
ncbi:unnamed protein product [Linum trigynum]|uniref:SANT domain-containing protein n=1 Tax=Linum trigynum TaxID=586398 RepID=A0AAV2CAZ1_9ROSI